MGWDEHQSILDAIERGDASRPQLHVRAHGFGEAGLAVSTSTSDTASTNPVSARHNEPRLGCIGHRHRRRDRRGVGCLGAGRAGQRDSARAADSAGYHASGRSASVLSETSGHRLCPRLRQQVARSLNRHRLVSSSTHCSRLAACCGWVRRPTRNCWTSSPARRAPLPRRCAGSHLPKCSSWSRTSILTQ